MGSCNPGKTWKSGSLIIVKVLIRSQVYHNKLLNVLFAFLFNCVFTMDVQIL